MLWREVVTLVKNEGETDGEGYKTEMLTRREVFADKKTATQTAFFTAKRSGAAIEIVFLIRAVDYDDERRVEYWHANAPEVTKYDVVRHFSKTGEILELHCSLAETPGGVGRKVVRG